ncbi:hypothetical protein J5N97_020329 [Dioscorea zingiberensis]|uniref:DUF7950 domain-containing protein n=1 Tax=Dioscorea zingiberensis TaxID=325984 RepID=A0A9D5CHS8_9LILI|nr:hypothetical protein J5N97_020329 [Dioscorea zingiberensis]
MERRGGCCIVRYGGEPAVAWKMDRIMLRFRPIAPKPSMGGSGTPAAAVASDGCTATGKGGRKRRGSAARDGGRGRKVVKKEDNSNTTSKSNSNSSSSSASSIVTLALMPETPERKEEKEEEVKSAQAVTYIPAAWKAGMASGVVVAPMPVRTAGSLVTVECVTDTWREGVVVGSWWGCEEEARRAAATDTCPVFLSGELDRVTWTNEAYRRMVVGEGEDEEEEEEEVRVSLVTRGMIPPASPAFTCRVRVRYACRKGKGSLAAPCDVWRLADGALAWRLDVNAALSLSLGR